MESRKKLYRSASFPFPRLERVLSAVIITGADLGLGVHEIGAVLRSFRERYSRRVDISLHKVREEEQINDVIANYRYSERETDDMYIYNEAALYLRDYYK